MGYIAILDYGAGNLKSVTNAMDYLGFETRITGEASVLDRAKGILLPGVGAFPDAMEHLRARGLDEALLREAERGKPLLGICLGMQLLFDGSDEVRPCPGLGLIPGEIRRIKTPRKLPHIGWNDLHHTGASPLLAGVPEGSYVYFVHSYCARPKAPEDLLADTEYGVRVAAAAGRGAVFGCQFHPEKSGAPGLQILTNFGGMCK